MLGYILLKLQANSLDRNVSLLFIIVSGLWTKWVYGLCHDNCFHAKGQSGISFAGSCNYNCRVIHSPSCQQNIFHLKENKHTMIMFLSACETESDYDTH